MLFAKEKLDHVVDDIADVWSERGVVTVHLVDNGFQKMSHTLQNLVIKSLHLLLDLLMTVDYLI